MIEVIEAQECLVAITVSSFPELKKESRDKIHRSVYKKAFPSSFGSDAKPVAVSDIGKALGRALGG